MESAGSTEFLTMTCTCFVLQGQGDSALDTLWKKKAEQIQQQ